MSSLWHAKRPYTAPIVLLVLAFLIIPSALVVAQTAPSTSVADKQAALQAQLDQVMKDIAAQQAILDDTERQSSSIERDIAILDAKIAQAQLIIKAKTITIQQLGKDISDKSATIETLSTKISNSQDSLGQLIRKTNEIDNVSLAEAFLGTTNISDVLSDVDALSSVKQSLYGAYQATKGVRVDTETARTALDKRQKAEIDAQQAIVDQKANIQKDEAQKQQLLAINKTQQKTYKQLIADRQKKADQIRAALFSLRDSAAIPFGTALQLATEASKKTGVRPAFLLAILTQETNLGQNIGTCNRPGDPAEKSWRAIMKPDRDQGPYLKITSALSLNPDTQPLSCPWKGGWGGAMGPSQFIPSTWLAFQPQLAPLLGVTMPNPWNPKDAFMASSLYLAQLGADTQSYSDEREAALRYYAGGAWNKKANAFYGNQVMAKAANIQTTMIDPLQNN